MGYRGSDNDKEYRREYAKRTHAKEKLRENCKKQYARGKALMDSLRTPCIVCGESELCALDFHHLSPEDKEHTPSQMKSMPLERIRQEVSKCVSLCSNCHRKVHAGKMSISTYLQER